MGSTFLCYIPGEPHINMAGLGIIDSISIPQVSIIGIEEVICLLN
jgi:hypothetical protein